VLKQKRKTQTEIMIANSKIPHTKTTRRKEPKNITGNNEISRKIA
jgi:hypothetical protein